MIRITRLAWIGIAVVLLAPWAVLVWLFKSPPPAPVDTRPPRHAAASSKVDAAAPDQREGRWGRLSYRRIAIEPPEEFIPDNYVAPPPRWYFKTEADKLEEIWALADLSPAQRAALNDPAVRKPAGDAVMLEPPVDVVLGLSPEARALIYTKLAEFPENGAQREPFRFRSERVEDWFENSGLSDEIVALTQQLIYQRRGSFFFSDYDVVLPRIPPEERTLYLKTLSRKTTLLVTLHVNRETDVNALARYWGRGRRAKDVNPLLQSLARQPQGGVIDIVHLIPRFARSLLYTFPLPSDDVEAANRDCHWTSFNFYSDQPDERFTSIDFVKETLIKAYFPIAGEPQLGDIIMFVQPGGVVIHSCVYIADDIVFTKNGPSFAVPWQFAQLDSVISFYSVGDQPIETRRYRSRDH